MIGRPISTLYYWRRKGKGPPVRLWHGRYQYKRDELVVWTETDS